MGTLNALGVPSDRVTFNISAYQPWLPSNVSIDGLKELRAGFPEAWITFNVPVPIRLGYDLVIRAAQHVGGKVGVALQAQLVNPGTVAHLRGSLTVNVWNHPPLWEPADIAAETARLRAMGVDGMIDLRRRDDPLADS